MFSWKSDFFVHWISFFNLFSFSLNLVVPGSAFANVESGNKNQAVDSNAPSEPISESKRGQLNKRGVANKNCLWPQNQVIFVKFLDGDASLHEIVERVSKKWQSYMNLRLNYVNQGPAHVRISFKDSSSYSYIGTCGNWLDSDQTQPTMNLAITNADSGNQARLILHEFGHAFNLAHEHQRTDSGIEWNVPAVLAAGARMGWSEETTRHAYMAPVGGTAEYIKSDYDRDSIMHYSIGPDLTLNKVVVKPTCRLSLTDKVFINSLYPAPVGEDSVPDMFCCNGNNDYFVFRGLGSTLESFNCSVGYWAIPISVVVLGVGAGLVGFSLYKIIEKCRAPRALPRANDIELGNPPADEAAEIPAHDGGPADQI